MSELWVGTSGYVYPHWRRGVFYPVGLRQRDELAFYARHFSTVELNNPFYRLPGPEIFERWRDAVPEGFVFAVKASRYITHVRRLRDVAEPLALLLDPGWARSSSSCRRRSRRISTSCAGSSTRFPRVAAGSSSSATPAGIRRRCTRRSVTAPSRSVSRSAGGSGPTW